MLSCVGFLCFDFSPLFFTAIDTKFSQHQLFIFFIQLQRNPNLEDNRFSAFYMPSPSDFSLDSKIIVPSQSHLSPHRISSPQPTQDEGASDQTKVIFKDLLRRPPCLVAKNSHSQTPSLPLLLSLLPLPLSHTLLGRRRK